MSLLKCTECGNEVSSKAPSCPNCGAPIKTKRKVGCLGSIIIVIVALILIGKISTFFDERPKEQKRQEDSKIAAQIERERSEQKQAKEKAIFLNGSLHRSSVSQWKTASTSNRIATAADWAITIPSIERKVRKSGTMDTLKPYAVSLVKCINEAAKGQGSDNMSTSELAAACVIMMKW